MSSQHDNSEGTATFADALASNIIDLCEIFESMLTSAGSTDHLGVTAQVQTLLEAAKNPPRSSELSYYQTRSPRGSTFQLTPTHDPPPTAAPAPTLLMPDDLSSMAHQWTPAEIDARRRVVVFAHRIQETIQFLSFRPLAAEDPSNSLCVSCIYWAERGDWFITSVDFMTLLQELLAGPMGFSVEEKNQLREILGGFGPVAVKREDPDTETFFRLIMAFPNPKPRNVEATVRVFPWSILARMLQGIIGGCSKLYPTLHQRQNFWFTKQDILGDPAWDE
ncbi:hypothetical protein BJ166DRAFT_625837 [Pestalotiopsis sp. NC0098]|nr:hypothetical protein BJ166DRAFT_625837 [Pestalotiopsis sp. NC0098]